ncbi:MAG TPA: hypothetical protein EYQ73_02660 [Candidatus Poseidoniales archaeon]|nr:MAG: hypothetical protein CXT71_04485 [Euryarchaeota archaeon]HIF45682.1 hypothetical protein [Candidatus Poseidoniales archaeon]HIL65785.1 hypothetical protein [Candidatus Poseidoniales archaeon]
MAKEEPEDELLSKRDFDRAAGVNLGGFMVADLEDLKPEPKPEEFKEIDEAVGEVADIFSRTDESSNINRDGTVDVEPEIDSVTEFAVEGEKRLHIGLLISMIVTWSAIGAIVGTTLGPTLSAIGLLSMAAFGLWLGEKWIAKPSMHILGVTWVIISMKLLYGLAISMNAWGWLDPTLLGIVLLFLVALNILIAQRHDEDAIAAQATIVLLVIGSGAGALYGQIGVVLMIGIGTLLFHSLAYLRKSGNLASLGIAASYLWMGLHAISDGWVIGGIEIVKIEDSLLLFLLMFAITGVNAVMAAAYAKEENWFSSGFNAMGLGKPGLWSVSVGLGMIGALLAIGAHRLETGYALAQLILLISAFAPSYLVVRGESWKDLQKYTLWPTPVLLAILILLVKGIVDIPFSEPWSIYAALSALMTAVVLLNHQNAVSDHVLWTGSIVLVILLTMLIPADNDQGARTLLVSQLIIWLGLGWLAIQRDSPSLAGTAVLAPWIWLLAFASKFENRIVSFELLPIQLPEFETSLYILILIGMQIPLNLKLGETGVNLATRLAGMSEFGARLRDSGMMRLWNIGFVLALVTILFITRPGAIPAYGLILAMAGLLLSHSVIIRLDRHQGTPRLILISWGLAAIILQWRFGFGSTWIAIYGISAIMLVEWSEDNARRKAVGEGLSHEALMPGKLITTVLGFIAMMTIIIGLEHGAGATLSFTEKFPSQTQELRAAALASFAIIGILYLPRAASFERLMPPAMSTIAVIVSLGIAAMNAEDNITVTSSIIVFIITGGWLAAQGEIRSRMKQVSKREQRLEKHLHRAEINRQVIESQIESGGNMKIVDADLLALADKQKKRSKRRGSVGEHDLIIGDIHHKPTIVLSFIGVTILVAVWLSWSESGIFAIAVASFISVLFIGIARWRADQVGLQLGDMMGIESPVALTMVGLTIIHISSRLGDGAGKLVDQWGLLVLLGALIILAGISLLGRKDLGLRIPSALEGIVGLLLLSRALSAFMGLDQIMVDPLFFSENSWRIPVFSVEIFLVIAVLLFEWVESERHKRDLSDHRGAAGRFGWAALLCFVSFGPAGLLACGLAVKNSVRWTQPALMVGVAVFAPYSWFSFANWYEGIEQTTSLFAILLGLAGLVLAVWSTWARQGLWLPAGLWIGHLLLIPGSFTQYEMVTVFMVCATLLVSTTSWLIGVLTLRRAWRIFGAIDLVLALAMGGKLALGGAGLPLVLIMLIATAILLGLVTWLGQTHEQKIAIT